MTKAQAWSGKTGGGNFGQNFLLFLFRHTKVKVGYFFVGIAVPFYMLFGRKGYKAIFYFFHHRIGFSKMKAFVKTFRNHYLFGQVIMDRFSVLANGKTKFSFDIHGKEHFMRLLHQDKGFIIASSHMGNFELGGYLLHQDVKVINSIVYAGESNTLQQNRKRIFGTHHIKLIPVYQDMSHLFAINTALSDGEIISMPCDRLLGSAKHVECSFLGKTAKFPLGAFQIATVREVEIISFFVIKTTSSHYNIYIEPISVDVVEGENSKTKAERMAKCFAKKLEAAVKKAPEQWFNYYDFWN
ncbi:MAG: lysophospholipid acyltransferase family protein [Bacteroidales bacterium]